MNKEQIKEQLEQMKEWLEGMKEDKIEKRVA